MRTARRSSATVVGAPSDGTDRRGGLRVGGPVQAAIAAGVETATMQWRASRESRIVGPRSATHLRFSSTGDLANIGDTPLAAQGGLGVRPGRYLCGRFSSR